MNDLMSLLFKTDAFKVCKENEPFWLTSGTISPYFSNTHFLYGSEKSAQEFLDFIDVQLETVPKDLIPANLFEQLLKQYETNDIYKTVIDTLKEFIEKKIDLNIIDYISGGERRDWFFSILIAYLLGKPHITIYKDLTTVVNTCDFEESTPVEKLPGKRVLHIADLITMASSYLKFWIPAIKNLEANIVTSISVVNRLQGGDQVLNNLGIRSLSLLQIDETLFEKAKELGVINEAQFKMLQEFAKEPFESMRNFLIAHPEFLENSLNSSNAKTVKRAKVCQEQNLYKL